jgi:hypothetical protein
MRYLIFASVLTLTGCASAPPPSRPPLPELMQDALQPYVGRNVRDVVARIGYPVNQREMLGDQVYSWTTDATISLPMPTSNLTTGTISGQTYWETTSGTQNVSFRVYCTVQFATDTEGKVKQYHWNGTYDGCANYAHALYDSHR